jgi:hypothetical protein
MKETKTPQRSEEGRSEAKSCRQNSGSFKPGYDPRRHRFTRDECVKGFWNAVYSIIERYPDAVDSSGRHMSCEFLKVAGRDNKRGKEN